jgi:dTDP-glucose pyrophosphorylase
MLGISVTHKNHTILSAMKLMDEIKRKVLFIIDEKQKFIGVLSVGDLQRAIINQFALDTPVQKILRKHITVASTKQSREEIKHKMIEDRVESMPVIDEKGYLKEVIYWEDIIKEKQKPPNEQLNLPVVIMAGGKGTRLQPITNVIPKPLIPIGNKTMLEDIMDSFIEFGCHKFYISVNYRSDIIEYYLKNQTQIKYDATLFSETKPLGTAGSLHLLENKISGTFFVTNCDIIIDEDYSEILRYHRENKNELTVIAALKNYPIPYGTIETKENGILESITEKPELTFKINTGLYILESHLIQEVPKNEFFHITSLINKLQKEKRRVGVFPVSENSWTDIGDWKEYMKYINE